MNITVLIENTSDLELQAEHGLSLFIEYNGEKYLLDAGSTGIFVENAECLKIPLEQVECCILSHGHYDHAGGFGRFLKLNSKACLYMMRTAVDKYYSLSGGLHEIGIPENVLIYQDRFRLIEENTKLAEGMWLIPHTTEGLEKIGKRAGLLKKNGEELLPDDFLHELSLVFDTEKGLVIFNSCSHAGIKNILEEVKAVFPEKKLYAFLGGLHMKGTKDGQEICTFSEEEIQEIAVYLQAAGLEYLYTGHCTGQPGYEPLLKYMGDKLKRLSTGATIEL